MRFVHAPNAVRVPNNAPSDRRSGSGRFTLLFMGTLNYYPNEDAAILLCRDVLPLLRDRVGGRREVRLVIAGALPSAAVRALADVSGVVVAPDVLDLTPLYAKADVVLVPLRAGGGTRYQGPRGVRPPAPGGCNIGGCGGHQCPPRGAPFHRGLAPCARGRLPPCDGEPGRGRRHGRPRVRPRPVDLQSRPCASDHRSVRAALGPMIRSVWAPASSRTSIRCAVARSQERTGGETFPGAQGRRTAPGDSLDEDVGGRVLVRPPPRGSVEQGPYPGGSWGSGWPRSGRGKRDTRCGRAHQSQSRSARLGQMLAHMALERGVQLVRVDLELGRHRSPPPVPAS